MVEAKKRTSSRKAAKQKSGQRTLLDIFSVRTSSLKSTDSDATSDAPRPSQQSTRDTAPSSPEVELVEIPRDSSSPPTVDIDTLSSDSLSYISDPEETKDVTNSSTGVLYSPNLPLRASQCSATDGASRDAPIVIDATPAKPAAVAKSHKPLFSIFASRGGKSSGNHVSHSYKPKAEKLTDAAPFPNRYSQHVRGDQSNFTAPGSSLGRRTSGTSVAPVSAQSPSSAVDVVDYFPNHGSTPPDLPVASTSSAPSIIEPSGGPDVEHITSVASDAVDRNSTLDSLTICHVASTSFDISARTQYIASMPSSHRERPAIANNLTRTASSNCDDLGPQSHLQELWTDKWRPHHAEEVIGNEEDALYLRDWLTALKLHIEDGTQLSRAPVAKDKNEGKNKKNKDRLKPRGSKRPRVLRRVQKPRKRRKHGDDRWIAGSSDETEEEPPESDDELLLRAQPHSRLRRASTEGSSPGPVEPVDADGPDDDAFPPISYAPFSFGNEIYNSILLVGPPGCGKTAAVYACAEELGWDVFEVYPGIGERSGAALHRLIGEVGKNHLVRQTQRQQKEPPFRNANPVKGKGRASGRRPQRIDSDELSTEEKAESTAVPPSDPRSVGQSIVLVEEVDVLFERDTNFWPALINILKDCRRPVVMTCNDLSLVPTQDLPLQEILTFAPCPISLATSYLQSLCVLERSPLERALLSELYQRSEGSSLSSPSDATPTTPISHPDLRRTINRLQFGLTRRDGDLNTPDLPRLRIEDEENLSILQSLSRHRNIISFADCHLEHRPFNLLQDDMTADTSMADLEQGHTVLRDTLAAERTLHWNPAFYHRDQVIADEVARCSRDLLDGLCPVPTAAEVHARAAGTRDYATQMDGVLRALKVPPDALADGAAVALDYDPWVRRLVAVDDALEEADAGAPKLTGRVTRNSQPERYTRCIALKGDQRRTLADTAFGMGT